MVNEVNGAVGPVSDLRPQAHHLDHFLGAVFLGRMGMSERIDDPELDVILDEVKRERGLLDYDDLIDNDKEVPAEFIHEVMWKVMVES